MSWKNKVTKISQTKKTVILKLRKNRFKKKKKEKRKKRKEAVKMQKKAGKNKKENGVVAHD